MSIVRIVAADATAAQSLGFDSVMFRLVRLEGNTEYLEIAQIADEHSGRVGRLRVYISGSYPAETVGDFLLSVLEDESERASQRTWACISLERAWGNKPAPRLIPRIRAAGDAFLASPEVPSVYQLTVYGLFECVGVFTRDDCPNVQVLADRVLLEKPYLSVELHPLLKRLMEQCAP